MAAQPLSGGVIVAAGEGAGKRNWGAHGNYRGGPFAASAVFQRVGKDGGAAPMYDTDTWQLAASYELRTVKLFAQTGRVENRTKGKDFRLHHLASASRWAKTRCSRSTARSRPPPGRTAPRPP